MSRLHRGDTLIEVLVAFSILSIVMATAFNGAIYGYRTSRVSLERTQASLAVQYQIEALKTYRNSMSWSGDPSFLGGSTTNGSNFQAMDNIQSFCMKENLSLTTPNYWTVDSSPDSCNTTLAAIAPSLAGRNQTLTIQLKSPSSTPIPASTTSIAYDVTVSWTPSNSSQAGYTESSTASVVLTKD